MSQPQKTSHIKYLNRDFAGFKRDLINYSQAHRSGVLQDFNEASPTMAILELQSYVGDVLSYYQDFQFNELRRETARQLENVVSFAKSLGYKPQGKRAARVRETFFIEVPATTVNGQSVPDDRYSPILRKGSQVKGPGGIFFETLDDLVFSGSTVDYPRQVTGSQFDPTTGAPTYFAIKKDVQVVAGQTVTESFTVGDFVQFRQIDLSQNDVLEILSVVDSSGQEYTEVDHLAQDTVFDIESNPDDDSDVVPYVMKLVTVPRRFEVDRDPSTGVTSLIFGSGDGQNLDDELVPNLADLAIPLAGRRTFSSFPLDPQNFLKTRSLGVGPYNTTLTVKYRVGGGTETNVVPRSIDTPSNVQLDFSSTTLDPLRRAAVIGSLACLNLKASEGGAPAETVTEIKANSSAFFAAQDRVVTREDVIARVMSLPSKFGKPEKVFVRKNPISPASLDLHMLAKDVNGHMTYASPNLKANVKTYLSRYRMMTSGINILDGTIINLRCNFGVVLSSLANRTEVLVACLNVVKDYLDIDRRQIGQPIVVSELAGLIQAVAGVVSVYEIVFTNVIGNAVLPGSQLTMPYSTTRFDVTAFRRNEIIYCPAGAIFEVKYPTLDIVGVPK